MDDCSYLKGISADLTVKIQKCDKHNQHHVNRDIDLEKGTVLLSSNYTAHKEITKINIDGCRTIIKIEKEPTYVEKLKICNMETLMDFLNMELVQEQLKSFMSERIYSKRHQMFSLDDERQNCNGKELSRLHRSSNPAYLTDMTGKICDVKAINHIIVP